MLIYFSWEGEVLGEPRAANHRHCVLMILVRSETYRRKAIAGTLVWLVSFGVSSIHLSKGTSSCQGGLLNKNVWLIFMESPQVFAALPILCRPCEFLKACVPPCPTWLPFSAWNRCAMGAGATDTEGVSQPFWWGGDRWHDHVDFFFDLQSE